MFTKEAAAREAESKEIEEKRQELEKMLARKAAKRVRSPEELEDVKGAYAHGRSEGLWGREVQ